MKKLDEIKEKAENSLIEAMSDRCLEVLLEGGDFRLEKGELEDDWHALKDEAADRFTPSDDDIVRLIMKESPKEMEESFNFVKNEIDPEFGKDCDQYISLMKTVVFHHLITDMFYNSHNIFWKTDKLMLEKLQNEFDLTKLNDSDYILEQINKRKQGYPLLVAGKNVIDDSKVVKEAMKYQEWMFDYSSPRLFEMGRKTSPKEAIEKDILMKNLTGELAPGEKKQKKNKI